MQLYYIMLDFFLSEYRWNTLDFFHAGKSVCRYIISNRNTDDVKDTDPSVLLGFNRRRPCHVNKWL